MRKHYDYLFVGAGLFNAVLAYRARKMGYSCLVIDKRDAIGGNCHTYERFGITVHKYGAHIFHTSNREVWDFVNKFTDFNTFINTPVAQYSVDGSKHMANLPFNMNTFAQLFNVSTPEEAAIAIEQDKVAYEREHGISFVNYSPKNLEEQAISMVGPTIFNRLIKGYTEKQWGKPCDELPPDIIRRLPLRMRYDNNYFNDIWQGIPSNGYTAMIEKMFDGCDVRLGVNMLQNAETKKEYLEIADHIFYSGRIEEFYNYEHGVLEYRSLTFKTDVLHTDNAQGAAVINYTDGSVPFTRRIEHKWFDPAKWDGKMSGEMVTDGDTEWIEPRTVLTTEYPAEWHPGTEPYYPVNNEKNNAVYRSYEIMHAVNDPDHKIEFVGRLGLYKYLDMDKVVEMALKWYIPKKPNLFERIFGIIPE